MTKVKGAIVEAHAYFRNELPEWAVDVELVDGSIVTAYHHPRGERNKEVTEQWAKVTKFMDHELDQELSNGPEVSLKVVTSPEYGVTSEIITLQSDESARSGIS